MDSDSSMERDSGVTLEDQERVGLPEEVEPVQTETTEGSKSSTPITTPAVVAGDLAALGGDRMNRPARTEPLPEEVEVSSESSPISEVNSEEGITHGLRTQLREERRESVRQSELADMMAMLTAIAEMQKTNTLRTLEAEARNQESQDRLAQLERQILERRGEAKETSPRQSHSDTEEEFKEDEPPLDSESDRETRNILVL